MLISKNLINEIKNKKFQYNPKEFVIDYVKSINLFLVNTNTSIITPKEALYSLEDNLLVKALINIYSFNESTFDVVNDTYLRKDNVKELMKQHLFILFLIDQFCYEEPKLEEKFYCIIQNVKNLLVFIPKFFNIYNLNYLYDETETFFNTLAFIYKVLSSGLNLNSMMNHIFQHLQLDIKKEMKNHSNFSKAKALINLFVKNIN